MPQHRHLGNEGPDDGMLEDPIPHIGIYTDWSHLTKCV